MNRKSVKKKKTQKNKKKKDMYKCNNLNMQLQSGPVISNSKGLSEIHRDTRTST